MQWLIKGPRENTKESNEKLFLYTLYLCFYLTCLYSEENKGRINLNKFLKNYYRYDKHFHMIETF